MQRIPLDKIEQKKKKIAELSINSCFFLFLLWSDAHLLKTIKMSVILSSSFLAMRPL